MMTVEPDFVGQVRSSEMPEVCWRGSRQRGQLQPKGAKMAAVEEKVTRWFRNSAKQAAVGVQ